MNRHLSLRPLSRDHHHALVVARALSAAAEESAPAALVDRAEQAWNGHIAGHFLIEERELWPLSLCGTARLRDFARTVWQQHQSIRALFGRLDSSNLISVGPELGVALAEHVRFEERSWFLALENDLAAGDLAALAWRAVPEPRPAIADLTRDDEGVWFATLECGHRQHIQHDPPFHLAAWVETEDGRRSMLGTGLVCPLCRMPRLPPCAAPYRETPVHTASTLPAGLTRSHTLKADTWARIVVHTGRVHYTLEDERLRLTLEPGVDGQVAPVRPHHIALDHDAQVQIRFLRIPEGR